jgi:hypothetical protein
MSRRQLIARHVAAAALLALAACAETSAGYAPFGAPVGRLVAGDVASRELRTVAGAVEAGYTGTVERIDTPVVVRPGAATFTGTSTTHSFRDLTLINRQNFDGVDVRGGGALEAGLRGSVRAEGAGFFQEEANYVDAVTRAGPAFLVRQAVPPAGERRVTLALYPVVNSAPADTRNALLDLQDRANLLQPKLLGGVKTGDPWLQEDELRRLVLAVTGGLPEAAVTKVTGGGEVLGATTIGGRRSVVVKEQFGVELTFTGGSLSLGGDGYSVYDVATGLPVASAIFGGSTMRRQGQLFPSEIWTVTSVKRTIQ